MSDQPIRDLPFSMATLVFGAASIPLSFAVHLVSLAFVIAVLALALGLWGRRKGERRPTLYSLSSMKRSQLGLRMGAIGLLCAVVMWVLWATNVLL
ncbi:MAG: hypothetical protein IT225_07030 [Flavobacteriales bacterium]|jgi:hypothetical protein|nr:hypothetical protein [Flavobacteriales bacterium]